MRSEMKMIVVNTITTTLDVDTMEPSHKVEIDDQDGLYDISPQVLGALLFGGMKAAKLGIAEKFGVELLSQDETKKEG